MKETQVLLNRILRSKLLFLLFWIIWREKPLRKCLEKLIISFENLLNGIRVFLVHFYCRCIWLVWLFTPNKWLQIPIKVPLVIYLQYHKDRKTHAVPELLYLVQTKARYVLVKVTLIVAYENIIIGRARKKNRIARLPVRYWVLTLSIGL